MNKIEKLTEEQVSKFPYYVDKYIKLGLSTEKFTEGSKTKIINIISDCYKAGNIKPPKDILFFNNPSEMCTFAKKNGDTNCLSNLCYGSFDASWLSFYSYFINEVPEVKNISTVAPLISLVGLCSYWLPYENVTLVSQNPLEIHKNENGLHNLHGPALIYAGDFEPMFFINGIKMPRWVVETPADELDCKEIMRLTNVDQRREALRKVGPENLIKSLEGKTLDTEKVSDNTKHKFGIVNLKRNLVYSLIELNFGDGMIARYLKMDNPSIDVVHIEGVPNSCDTVFAALAFRNTQALKSLGIDSGKWLPPINLT